MHAKLIDSLKLAVEQLQSVSGPGTERQILADVIAEAAAAAVQIASAKPSKPAPAPQEMRSLFGDIFQNKAEPPKVAAPSSDSVSDPWLAVSKAAILLSGSLSAWEVDARIKDSESAAQKLAVSVQRLAAERRVAVEGELARIASDSQQILKLRQDVERLQAEAEKPQQEYQTLRLRLQELQQRREEFLQSNTMLLEEAASLELELSGKQEQMRKLESTRQQLLEADSRLQRIEAELADLNNRHRLARDRADQLQQTVEATRMLVTVAESRSNDAHAQRILSIWRELPADAFDLP